MRAPREAARLAVALACTLVSLICSSAASHAADDSPVVVGAVVSQSGANAAAASAYRRGLELWLSEVNGAGGLLGRRVELRLLDDESEAVRVPALYERLLRDERADLLIGPYGSAASAAAAAVAERSRRVLLNASGAARAVHKAGHAYVFQITAPYASYGTGIVDLAKAAEARSLFVVTRNDAVSQESAKGFVEAARAAGLSGNDPEVFAAGLDDFGALIAKARSGKADAWIGFGQARDAADMVKSFVRLDYAPRLFVAQGAADPAFVRTLGQAAEYAIGIVPYDPAWKTKDNASFVQAYRARWSSDPPLAAAQAFAAGRVIEEAVRRAKTLDSQVLRPVLAQLETETPLGAFRIDRRLGEQLGARPALVQIQRGRAEVVWPVSLATAMPVLRYPGWRERGIAK